MLLLIVGGVALALVGYLVAKYKTAAGIEAELKSLESAGLADAKSVIARIRKLL
jgi:hypothetical protein